METVKEDTIKERLRIVIAKELKVEPESIADDAHIGNDLGIDSADMISVLYDIEDEFKVEISDEEVGEISTIQEMYNVVNAKIKQV
ncbi:MAG: acyl carrier protein [Candidatus Scalindua sp.]|jgi:acyl carrier protein|nr:acyl carrier protein [Candidatus Scalindua sp.]MBT7591483.1 acyl carrier protein [Candidatus Scalindua sp.]